MMRAAMPGPCNPQPTKQNMNQKVSHHISPALHHYISNPQHNTKRTRPVRKWFIALWYNEAVPLASFARMAGRFFSDSAFHSMHCWACWNRMRSVPSQQQEQNKNRAVSYQAIKRQRSKQRNKRVGSVPVPKPSPPFPPALPFSAPSGPTRPGFRDAHGAFSRWTRRL